MAKSKFALGTLIAAAAGFAAALLTAPKSGKETRADIKEKAVKAKNTAVEEAEMAKEIATEKVKEVRGKAEDVARDIKAKVEEVTEDVTDKATELKDRAEQAVEGAKKGFAQKPKSTKKK